MIPTAPYLTRRRPRTRPLWSKRLQGADRAADAAPPSAPPDRGAEGGERSPTRASLPPFDTQIASRRATCPRFRQTRRP
jgi:hypothetical protein